MKSSMVLGVAFVVLVGCTDSERPKTARNDPDSIEHVNGRDVSKNSLKLVDITPQAQEKIREITRDFPDWWLVISAKPGGCTGIQYKLDVESVSPNLGDVEHRSGEIRCLTPGNQMFLVQGLVVGYKNTDKERGFTIDSVNQTNGNREKTSKWINAETDKRMKELDEKDRLAGKPGERIGQFRKLVIDDPENELGHFRLGQLLMEDAQYSEAVKSLERTLALSPDFSKAYQLLGECQLKLEQKSRAIEVLTKECIVAGKRGDDILRVAMEQHLTSLGVSVPKN